MKNIDILVNNLLKSHKGGTKFFDKLDENVRNIIYFDKILDLVKKDMGEIPKIIVSGKFGLEFERNMKSSIKEIIVTPGGLRFNSHLLLDNIKSNDKYVFIDDSYYSGSSRKVIEKNLRDMNSVLLKTFVIYDGSINKDNLISSLYRYHERKF